MSFEHHPNSKKVFDYYQDRFASGSLALWHMCGISSTFHKNRRKCLSSLIIANKGSYKTQMMKHFNSSYPSKTWYVPYQPTDRALVRECKQNEKITKNCLWYIDDAAITFSTLEGPRHERLVGLFTSALSNNDYSYSDFSETKKIKVDIGLYVNIAFEAFSMIKKKIMQNTFSDRVVPFNFIVSEEALQRTSEEYACGREYGKPPNIKMKLTKTKTINFSSYLNEYRQCKSLISKHCEIGSPRAGDWLNEILYDIAIIEGRDEVIYEDLLLFKKELLPYISLNLRLTPVERALLRYLDINPHPKISDCKEFFESTLCKNEFPEDYKGFNYIKDEEISRYLVAVNSYKRSSEEIKQRFEGDVDVG